MKTRLIHHFQKTDENYEFSLVVSPNHYFYYKKCDTPLGWGVTRTGKTPYYYHPKPSPGPLPTT